MTPSSMNLFCRGLATLLASNHREITQCRENVKYLREKYQLNILFSDICYIKCFLKTC